uniref:SGNH hydrolase-type esterase domain-containing protein n=1 Tax=Oryzias latipes TaxID=8090 RepID=A0A3P9L5C9_ORYLA
MDLAGSQSQRLATLNQTLQDTLPWNPEKPASCSTPNAASTWSEVVVRGYQKGPNRSLSTQAPGLNLVNRFAALADDIQTGESPQRPPLNPKWSAVTHEAEPSGVTHEAKPSAAPQKLDPNSSASVIPRRPGVERQIKIDTENTISRRSPVTSQRSSTSSSRRKILKNAVLRRCPGGLPSLESQRSGSLSQQEKMKEASPVQPSDVDSANSEPHIPPPRPLFAPTTLIVGDSIIGHVRFFNAVTRCFPGSTVRGILEKLPGMLDSLPTSVFRLIVHSVFISGPLPGLSPSTERFSRLLGMNTWLQTACMTRKCSFIDNFNLFWNRTSFYCLDGTHPNRMGSSILSANIRYAVQTLPRD